MKRSKNLKKLMAAVLAAVLFVMPLTGCFVKVNDHNQGPNPVETQKPDKKDDKNTEHIGEPENWAEHMNVITLNTNTSMKTLSFDEKLMAYLSANKEGNFMASPLSFRYALGLLLSGAEGETKEELLKALGVQDEQEWTDTCLRFNGFVEAYEQIFEHELSLHREYVRKGYIPDDGNEPFMALRVANSVWRNEVLDEKFTESFTEKVSKNYAAEYRTFLPDNVIQRVNEWVSIKTERMIERLLPDGYDTSELAVILMNALYFKDSWINEFYEGATKEGDFTTKTGSVTKKEFMNQEDFFRYYKDDATELVILPMKGNVEMAFVFGDTTKLAEKISKAQQRRVDVKIPKMDLETSLEEGELVHFLKECGVHLAFTEDADFTGMIKKPTRVTDIIQKTRIKLDEKGVEAAAVTAIMMDATSAMPEPDQTIHFYADHPFSFYIYANASGEMATMFAGQIVE